MTRASRGLRVVGRRGGAAALAILLAGVAGCTSDDPSAESATPPATAGPTTAGPATAGPTSTGPTAGGPASTGSVATASPGSAGTGPSAEPSRQQSAAGPASASAVGSSSPDSAVAGSPPGSTAAPGQGGTRLDAVLATKKLRVCTTGDYRPFSYLDPTTKKFTGIDITMAQGLAKSLDAEVQFVRTSWSDLMSTFVARCDIAAGGISITAARARQAFYSVPTLTEGKTPITLCGKESDYSTIAQINRPGVRVITPIGGTNEAFAEKNFPKATIIRFDDNNSIFDQIVAGKADVMVTDASETKWVAHTTPKLCAVHPDQPFDFSQKAYLLPRGDVVFQQYVDHWLTIALNNGEYAAAEKPWYG